MINNSIGENIQVARLGGPLYNFDYSSGPDTNHM